MQLPGPPGRGHRPLIRRIKERLDEVVSFVGGTPYLVRDALDTFDFGLQRLLDGIEAHVQRVREAEGRPQATR